MVFMRNRSLAAVALIVALAAGWTSVAVAFHPAAVRGTNTIVSQGTGRQVLEGGGLTYGSLAPGGVVRFLDLSPKRDGKFTVTAQVPASTQGAAAQSVGIKPVRQGGMWVFKVKGRQNATRSLAFSVAGSKFRLVLDGTSVLNGAGVTGKVTLVGTGTVAINGQTPPLEWTAEGGRLTLPAHPVVSTKPKTTVTTATTSTTVTTTTTTT